MTNTLHNGSSSCAPAPLPHPNPASLSLVCMNLYPTTRHAAYTQPHAKARVGEGAAF
jgi:hypothetical protein